MIHKEVGVHVDGIDAPITAGNFVDLVQRGVYDGLVFHRVVKSPQPFVAQGGDPLGNGTGGFDHAVKNQTIIESSLYQINEIASSYRCINTINFNNDRRTFHY